MQWPPKENENFYCYINPPCVKNLSLKEDKASCGYSQYALISISFVMLTSENNQIFLKNILPHL